MEAGGDRFGPLNGEGAEITDVPECKHCTELPVRICTNARGPDTKISTTITSKVRQAVKQLDIQTD